MSTNSATWWVRGHQIRRNQDAELTTIKQLPFTIIKWGAAVQSKSPVVCVMTDESNAIAVKASRVPTAGTPDANVSRLYLDVDGRIQKDKAIILQLIQI